MSLLDGVLTDALAAVFPLAEATVTLRRFTSVYSTATSSNVLTDVSGLSPHATTMVWWAAGSGDMLGPDGIVRPGDRIGLLKDDGLPFDPEKGDVIEFSSQQWRVMFVRPYSTGNSTLMWELVLRIGS